MLQTREIEAALLEAATELVKSPTAGVVWEIILRGVKQRGFDRVRLYLVSPDGTRLIGTAHSGMDVDFVDLEWPLDIDLHTQALCRDPRPHLFEAGTGPRDRFRELLGKTDALQWAEVPLVEEGKVIGKISVDNKFSGRRITEAELTPIHLFAELACAAHQKAVLVEKLSKRADDLAELQEAEKAKNGRMQAFTAAMADINRTPAADRLTLIARHVAEILNAETCAVLLVERDNVLRWHANWGHRPGAFQPGREFQIRSGLNTGLTGHMAYERRMCNLCGDEILKHPARAGLSQDSSPSATCHSILGVPLERTEKGEKRLVGMLRATNKKNREGLATPATRFSAEDEFIMQVFAESLVTSIDSADLLERLQYEKQFQQQLIASSPEPIIAIDGKGLVRVFNHEAEKALGYEEREVLREDVRMLYPPEEAEKIGRILGELRARNERLSGYETEAVMKGGQKVPIRLSASSWYNERGERLGSVGHLKDLRAERREQRRQDTARNAIAVMGRASNPPAALAGLARQLCEDFNGSWCQILFLSEDQSHFEEAATFPEKLAVTWYETLSGRRVKPTDPSTLEFTKRGALGWARNDAEIEERRSFEVLEGAGGRRELHLTPVVTEKGTVGLLAIGREARSAAERFTEEDIKSVKEIALQTMLAMEAMRWYGIATRQKERLEQLRTAVAAITEAPDAAGMRQAIVDQARECFQADYATLWSYDHELKKLLPEELAGSGFPADTLKRFCAEEPKPAHATFAALKDGHLEVADLRADQLLEFARKEELLALGIGSYRAVRLDVTEEPVGILYLSYKAQGRACAPDPYLAHFTSAAALAIKKARLSSRIERGKNVAAIVAKAMTAGDRARTLDAVTGEVLNLLEADIVTVCPCSLHGKIINVQPSVAGLEPSEIPGISRKLVPGTLVYGLLNEEGPHVAVSIHDDPLFRNSEFAKQHGIHSCIAAPLKVARREVGVMFVSFRDPHKPTAEELSTIQLCADQAAVAIEYAELSAERERDQRALISLLQESVDISRRQKILDRSLEITAKTLVDVQGCEVALFHGGRLEIAASWGRGAERVGRPVGEGKRSQAGYTTREGAVVAAPDLNTEDRFDAKEERENNFGAAISAPLRVDGETIGAIVVNTAEPRRFTVADAGLLELIAGHTAIALRQARQYESLARRNSDLAALSAVGKTIIETLGKDEPEMLHAFNRSVVDNMSARPGHKGLLGVIQRHESDKARLVFASIYPADRSPAIEGRLGKSLALDPPEGERRGINGRAVKKMKSQLVNDVLADPDYLVFDAQTRSQISVPLIFRESALGVLAVESEQPDAFDDTDLATMESLAKLVVIALHYRREEGKLRATIQAVTRLVETAPVENVQQTQDRVAQMIREALDCDAVTLYTQNPAAKALDHVSMIGVNHPEDMTPPGMFREDSLVSRMMNSGSIYLVPKIEKDPLFRDKRFVRKEGIQSCAAVPLRALGEQVGVLFVNYLRAHDFSADVDLRVLGAQAAVIIRNAQVVGALQRRQRHLTAIQEAGKAIAQAFGPDQNMVLDGIIEQVGRWFPSRTSKVVVSIQLKAGPSGEPVEKRYPPRESSGPPTVGGRDIGELRRVVARRTMETRKPQLEPDLLGGAVPSPTASCTRSLITAPLFHGGEPAGVLSVESECVADFDLVDRQTLEAIAELVGIAMNNSGQYAELKRMRGLVETRKAMAYMGLMSAVWRHSIEGDAIVIRDLADAFFKGIRRDKLAEDLGTILERAEGIIQKRPLPPLESCPEPVSTPLQETLRLWVDGWRTQLDQEGIVLSPDLQLPPGAAVHLSREWMCQALDVLVRNSVNAMEGRPEPRIRVDCRADNRSAEIRITDNGPGIPEETATRIRNQQVIPKARGAKGFGTGLLLSQAILEACDGELSLESTGEEGTTMRIVLPLES